MPTFLRKYRELYFYPRFSFAGLCCFAIFWVFQFGQIAHAAHFSQQQLIVDSGTLDGTQALAFSPDERFLYLGNTQASSLSVFSLDASTGDVTLIAVYLDNIDGIDGLKGINNITISPDGEHLYATGYNDGALVVFDRNISTGELNLVAVYTQDSNMGDLSSPNSVSLSPDGAFIYVTNLSPGGNLIAYARNSTTGELSFIEQKSAADKYGPDNVRGHDVVGGASRTLVSADGKNVYVTGFWYGTVAVFARDLVEGTLTYVEHHNNDRTAYPFVETYALRGALDLVLSGDDTFLYVASYFDGNLSVFSRSPISGKLTLLQDFRNNTVGFDGASSVSVSPDDRFVYLTGDDADSLKVFARDTTTGLLTEVTTYENSSGGIFGLDGSYDHLITSDGELLFCAGEDGDTLAIFNRDTTSGLLTQIDIKERRQYNTTGLLNGAGDVVLSPDGEHAYISTILDSAINHYTVDHGTGKLTFTASYDDIGIGTSLLERIGNLVVTPDGRHLYAVSQSDHAVAMFERDIVTGQLMLIGVIGEVEGLIGSYNLTVSPDGKNVYLTSFFDDFEYGAHTITTLSRDLTTGLLTVAAVIHSGSDPGGLYYPTDIMISDDGKDVYVSGARYHHLNHFRRDTNTGLLSFQTTYSPNGAMVLSPDQKILYVASSIGFGSDLYSWINVYKRDLSTGALTFMYEHLVDENGFSVAGIKNLAISSNGRYLFATSFYGNGLAVLETATSGELRTIDNILNRMDGIQGLEGAYGLVASKDGRFVYVTGGVSDSVSALSVNEGDIQLSHITPTGAFYPEITNIFNFEVNNNSATTADGAYFSYTTPAGVNIKEVSAEKGQCNIELRKTDCRLGALVPAESVLINITLSFDDPGTFEHYVHAGAAEHDTNMDDNSTTFSTAVILSNPPTAIDDGFLTLEDVVFITGNVLGNDSDPDNDNVIIISSDASSEQGGLVINNGDGTFEYTPPNNYNGTDYFSYTISDGKGSRDTAIVSISVVPQNDLPVTTNDAAETSSGNTITTGNVLANDTDLDGDDLFITSFDNISEQGGVVSYNDDGTFSYTPPASFVGTDAFGYVVSDSNNASASAMVIIAVAAIITTEPPQSTSSGGGGAIDPILMVLILIYLLIFGKYRTISRYWFSP